MIIIYMNCAKSIRNATCTTVSASFSCHGHDGHPLGLLSLLNQRTQRATDDGEKVAHTASVYSLDVSQFASDADSGEDVDKGDDVSDSTQTAAVPHRLGVLPERVAGNEVSNDTNPDIVETSTQSMTPFTHFGLRKYSASLL